MSCLPLLILLVTGQVPVLPDLPTLAEDEGHAAVLSWVDRVVAASADRETASQILANVHLAGVTFPVEARGGAVEEFTSLTALTSVELAGEGGLRGIVGGVATGELRRDRLRAACVDDQGWVLGVDLAFVEAPEPPGDGAGIQLTVDGLGACWREGGRRLLVHTMGEDPAHLLASMEPVLLASDPVASDMVSGTGILRVLSTGGETVADDVDLAALFEGVEAFAGVEGGIAMAGGGRRGGVGGIGTIGGSEDASAFGVALSNIALAGTPTHRAVLATGMEIRGLLGADQVRGVIAPRLAALAICPAGDLAGPLAAPGWIDIELDVSATGAVAGVRTLEGASPELEACVVGALVGASFPADETGSLLRIRVGFVTP